MRIDVHAHHFPEEYLQCLERMGSKTTTGARTAPGTDATFDERISLMDEAGIDLQVLSPAHQLPYFADRGDAASAARLGNDIFVDVCRKYAGRFSAFANVPLPHVDTAIDELGRCLDTLGMVGVTLGCSVAGRQLDDLEFTPFWAELDRRKAVLFLHPVGIGCPGADAYALTWLVGAPFEDTIAALRLVLSGLTGRFPNVKIIVPHLGGTLPFLMQRLDNLADMERARGTKLAATEAPSTMVRQLWFDTVNSYPPALRCAAEAFGADRLMLGTDWPFLVGPRFKRCVTYIEESGLPRADVDAILDTNAQRLLAIKR
jgi:6-methylsalicylate decarboxylase